MTDPPYTEEERAHIRPPDAPEIERPPPPPGTGSSTHARRSSRRRLAVASVSAAAVTVAGALVIGAYARGDEPAPASAACVRSVAEGVHKRQSQGFRPVYGALRHGRIAVDDGITQSSAFRFTVEGTLAGGTAVPSSGAVTVWYPVAEAQLPEPGRYLLLLGRAARPARNGEPLFEMAPERVLPLRDDGKLTVRCENGDGAVERERLRAGLGG